MWNRRKIEKALEILNRIREGNEKILQKEKKDLEVLRDIVRKKILEDEKKILTFGILKISIHS